MKQKLLLPLVAMTLVASNAGAQELIATNPVQKQISSKNSAHKVVSSKQFAKDIKINTLETPSGFKTKKLELAQKPNTKLNPYSDKKFAASGGDYVFNEDFESFDGYDMLWLPSGWSVKRVKSQSGHFGWTAYAPLSAYEEIKSKCMVFNYFDDLVDEWLITPEIEVDADMQLSFESIPGGVYYFDWDYIDFDTFEFTELKVLNDFIVNVSNDNGATWKPIKALSDDFKKTKSFYEMTYMMDYTEYKVSLSEYAGQKIKIGFQVVGEPEGNSAIVDNVKVGYPELNVAYSRPTGHLFFGLSKYDENLPASIMTVPVFSPVTFTNTSKNPNINVDYTWTYEDTDGFNTLNGDNKLSVTYRTNHESDFTSRNNLYEMPSLSASADRYTSKSFAYNYLVQAGGKGEYERYYTNTGETEIVDLGLTIVDPMTEGSATYADIVLPYFGYNQESDRFWTEYTFGKGEGDDENWTHLEKYGNLFIPTNEPLVIEGVRANAYGRVSRNTKFTAEIYLLNGGFVIPEKPYAVAVCTGDDITIIDRNASNHILSLNFKFDEPIVMSKDLAPYYVVAIGGFRDPENVEYFSPEMSDKSNPDKLALGWIGKQLCWYGQTYPISWSDVYGYVEEYVSFYIMLDAHFPWLKSETEEHLVSADSPTTLSLDSYYDGNDLSVEGLPDWLTASVSGRYGKTEVTFSSTKPEEDTATVTIKGHGVSQTVNIKNNQAASAADIIIDGNDDTGVLYNLSGQRVSDNDATRGFFILRKADGTSKKVIR